MKKSDFKGIANEFIEIYIPGEKNSDLRNYSRKLVDIAWNYNSSIVHSQDKSYPDVKIALLFTSSVISLIENLFFKYLGFDNEYVCSKCGSKQIEFIDADDKDGILSICKSCENEEIIDIKEN